MAVQLTHPSPEAPPSDTDVLRFLVEGTASSTGREFFRALVAGLCSAIQTTGAWVALYRRETRELEAIAMKMGDEWLDGLVYGVEGTPCETVIDSGEQVYIPDRIIEFYPETRYLQQVGAVSYLGAPLFDVDGTTIGHFAALHDQPLLQPRCQSVFKVFAARAGAELRRMKAEEQVRERETQLQRVLDGAMDAIAGLDDKLEFVLLNAAAERAFGAAAGLLGSSVLALLDASSAERVRAVARRLSTRSELVQSQWIAGGLRVLAPGKPEFAAEATLSHYLSHGQARFTLILRDVNDRLAAEETIRSLEQRAEALREELARAHGFDAILGASPALLAALDDVAQVAPMNATVLLLGETGTGKELFARAVHDKSPRRERSLITVNCAAIPKDLIESELFGHERGAFTGATSKRDGRFTLADGGTLFLDELGELPLALQAKLLRVLQEGEVTPVGSSRTRKVDVRVVAATNRDLSAAVQRGEFREDLYYRLNVFPIRIPPLRERDDDVILLAESFMAAAARRVGRSVLPLSADCRARLRAYAWPGNVRELGNVIERAVITSLDGRLNLERAFPEAASLRPPLPDSTPAASPPEILTLEGLRALERDNIVRALERSEGRVSGAGGAAALLGMNASTLASRIRALGIR